MANLIFCLSLVFSLCLLTHARMVRFPSAVSHSSTDQDFPAEIPLPSAKAIYSDDVQFPKPVPEIASESHTVHEPWRSDAIAAPLSLPAAMSFDLSFRPINPRLPPFLLTDRKPLRPRRHRCHHRHPIRGPRMHVPYGDDMIIGGRGMRKGSQAVATMQGPEGERAGEESRLRSWFWNIINGF